MQANVGSERFGDIDTDVMTDLRQMLQLNNSYARSHSSALTNNCSLDCCRIQSVWNCSHACHLHVLSCSLLWAFRVAYCLLPSNVARSSRHGPKGRACGLYAVKYSATSHVVKKLLTWIRTDLTMQCGVSLSSCEIHLVEQTDIIDIIQRWVHCAAVAVFLSAIIRPLTTPTMLMLVMHGNVFDSIINDIGL